jgi:N-acetylmannosamine-6-phosphate 2-epimerase/N-acetylmannosamine kinase
MSERHGRWSAARGRLIVSCQSSAGDAFHAPGEMARFAQAAYAGGAGGIRAHGAEDVAEIGAAVPLPVLGIHKEIWQDGSILITATFERAAALAAAGADAVALDCTARGVRFGAFERMGRMRSELGLPVLADIATIEEAEAAAAAGADFVLSTMRGFTADTARLAAEFEPEFVAALASRLSVPVIAEGRIAFPHEARAAMEAGAWAVVVGSAITRPQEVTRRFAAAVNAAASAEWTAAVDLGGSNLKYGLVSSQGELAATGSVPTNHGGAGPLLEQLQTVVRGLLATEGRAIGAVAISTAGWVDPRTGAISYATGNLEGWSGAPVRAAIAGITALPVMVENDAVCAAAGEWRFGAARGLRNSLCVTLGTGVGGGAVVEGRLLRGAHGLGPMLGHVPIPGGEAVCTCGRRGCLEAELRAAERGRRHEILAEGLSPAVHLFDPEVIVLTGGRLEKDASLPERVQSALATRVLASSARRLEVRGSAAGPFAGVRGAAALRMPAACR